MLSAKARSRSKHPATSGANRIGEVSPFRILPDMLMISLLFRRKSGTEPQNPRPYSGYAATPKPHQNPLARYTNNASRMPPGESGRCTRATQGPSSAMVTQARRRKGRWDRNVVRVLWNRAKLRTPKFRRTRSSDGSISRNWRLFAGRDSPMCGGFPPKSKPFTGVGRTAESCRRVGGG